MTSHQFDFAGRIERARARLGAQGLDGLLLSLGSDLPYLTGYEAMPLERLTMYVLTLDESVLLVPALEAARVGPGPFDLQAWQETDDPIGIVSSIVTGAGRLGIGDQTWASFLLRLQDRLANTAFVSATPTMSELRVVKEPAEIDLLRRAAHATDRVAARLADTAMAGMTERQLSHMVARWTVEEGHDVDTFKIVASGPNGASPHHEPTDRPIEVGDMVVIDFGGKVGGYCSDMTRMFVAGKPTDRHTEVHEVARTAQAAAVEAVRPGVPLSDIDGAARSVIDDAGYGDHFIHRTGHGIGLDVHEEPYVIETNPQPAETGMTFSIEPGIYLPGEFGVRIEDIVVVTEDGVERLNQADRSLVVVG